MYSQNDEERIVLEYLGRERGTFLDVGAFDGRTFSNTLRLAEMGWGGVCVEPSPESFRALAALHGERSDIALVHAALAPDARLVEFFDCDDAVSTTVRAHAEKWKTAAVRYRSIYVYTLPVAAFFGQFGHDFTFLNVDVEAQNVPLIQALPLGRMEALRMICVEYDNRADEVLAVCAPLGFAEVARNAENLLLYRG